VVFCRGLIYETRSVKESDESDRYNIWVYHQSPRAYLERKTIRSYVRCYVCLQGLCNHEQT